MAAVVYCRISQDRTGESAGVQRQQEDCLALCERSGWDVVEVLVDNDVSAYSGKRRPGWERAVEHLKTGTATVLVGWHPDRFTRQMRQLEDLVELVESTGATIATVTAGSYDLSTPSGRLVARNLGAAARYESEHKAERLRRKHVEIAKNGRRGGGGRRAFGYAGTPQSPEDPPRDTIIVEEADLIRDAARRVIAGQTLRSILRDWNDREVATVTGAQWQSTTLKRMLCSARISGQREHQGRIVGPAVWPAIISPADTARLRVILRDSSRDRADGVVARSYLLAGLVYCGRCQVKMTSRPTKRGKHRYVCVADRGGCNRCGISADLLEDYVAGRAVRRWSDPRWLETVDREPEEDERLILDAVEADEAALEQLATDHYVDRVIGRGEYLAARQALEARVASGRRRLVRSTDRAAVKALAGTREAVTARWEAMEWDARRAHLVRVVERVMVQPTTRANNRFDKTRVARGITWRI